ncbi:MAG: DNA repair protein RecO [Gammaproteobacteria bacterium]|nr:DNA repair protein RecO [Gammaproteobacteria bacterium]MCP5424372.1 DNA repair protein RecO [Gammaproteobacteria bacterium]
MRVALQPGFILHRRPYRDTSLLVEIFTQEWGRLTLVARGARGPRSRWRGLLQPFKPLLLSWAGKGGLGNLSGAEETTPAPPIPTDRLLCGFYVNELLLRLIQPHDPCSVGLFETYRNTLQALACSPFVEPVLRIYEKHLLTELGYGLLLDSEAVSNQAIIAQGLYRYLLDQGPLPMVRERPGPGIPVSGRALLALHHEALDEPALWREIKRLTRAALDLRLQGQVLKTRTLLRAEHQRRLNR